MLWFNGITSFYFLSFFFLNSTTHSKWARERIRQQRTKKKISKINGKSSFLYKLLAVLLLNFSMHLLHTFIKCILLFIFLFLFQLPFRFVLHSIDVHSICFFFCTFYDLWSLWFRDSHTVEMTELMH